MSKPLKFPFPLGLPRSAIFHVHYELLFAVLVFDKY
jgi:hypothetical protein